MQTCIKSAGEFHSSRSSICYRVLYDCGVETHTLADIYEVPIPRPYGAPDWKRSVLIVVVLLPGLLIVVGLLSGAVLAVSQWHNPIGRWALVITFAILLSFAIIAMIRRNRRLLRSLPDAQTSPSEIIARLETVFNDRFTFAALKKVARTLAGNGVRNCAIIARAPKMPPIPPPLFVQFEPIALNAYDPRLSDLVSSGFPGEDDDDAPAEASSATGQNHRRSFFGMIGRGLRVAFNIAIAVFLVYMLIRAVMTRTLPSHPITIYFVAVMIAQYIGPLLSRNQRGRAFIVAQSCLIHRRAGWFRTSWQLHLFDRRSSVLCVYPQYASKDVNVFRWAIADATHVVSGTAFEIECLFLLRAWLSPLPPPPIDQLTDLE